MKCASCGFNNPDGVGVCGGCGRPLIANARGQTPRHNSTPQGRGPYPGGRGQAPVGGGNPPGGYHPVGGGTPSNPGPHPGGLGQTPVGGGNPPVIQTPPVIPVQPVIVQPSVPVMILPEGQPVYAQYGFFDGTGGSFLGIYIVNVILLILTLGIIFPWVHCRNLRWRKSHTVINGRRLVFTGTAGQLFGRYILWWFLIIITIGFISFWVAIQFKRWEIEHTGFADQPHVMGMKCEGSFYDGSAGSYFGESLLVAFLTLITCGIYSNWGRVRLTKFHTAHSVIEGNRYVFNGTGGGLWGETTLVGLLILVTCGIYYSWGVVRVNKWVYSHTFQLAPVQYVPVVGMYPYRPL